MSHPTSRRGPWVRAALAVALATPATAVATDLADVFARVNPSVVEIVTSRTALPGVGATVPVTSTGLGSGFVISADGLVMTAAHVVHTADAVAVRFLDGDTVAARVVASEPHADVALIQVERLPEGVPPVTLGDSDRVRVGEQVFVVGAPLGVAHTLTAGHISGRHRTNDLYSGLSEVELLQTDAAINQGNSGGPMFDLEGEVVGVVSHIVTSTGGSQGLGFVITSNLARQLLLDAPSMWWGMNGFLLEDDLARLLNLPQAKGILVQQVAQGSPAAAMGLAPGVVTVDIAGLELTLGGDVILAVQGIRLDGADSVAAIRTTLAALTNQDILELEVLRGGQVITLRKAFFLLRGSS